MNQSSGPFVTKVAVIIGFFLGVIGIIVFAASNFATSSTDAQLTGTVKVWGTLPEKAVAKTFYDYSQQMETYTLTYTQVAETDFYDKFIEATAKGEAPDLVLAGENLAVPLRNYFTEMTPANLSENTFKSIFTRASYKLYGANGTFSVPVMVDPLVMYVNTNIMVNAGYNRPPETWVDLPVFVKQVVNLNKTNNISETRAVAMGTFANVSYAKELLLSLLLQLQNGVINRYFDSKSDGSVTTYTEKFESLLGFKDTNRRIDNAPNTELVFSYFASFINPNLEDYYTWSRRAPVDRELFAAGNLALYFGLASDKAYIDTKNPNLRYELAMIPTPKASESQYLNTGYVKVYNLAITKTAKNQFLAAKVVTDLSDKDNSLKLASAVGLAPARTELLSVEQGDPMQSIVYRSAGRGDIVLEPKYKLLQTLFDQMTESFAGSRLTPSEIVTKAQEELARQLENK